MDTHGERERRKSLPRRRVVRFVAGAVVVGLVGLPLGAHALRARRAEHADLDRMRALTAQLAPLARKAKTGRRVFLNGRPTFFGVSTAAEDVRATLDRVEKECAGGDLGVRLDPSTLRDDSHVAETLELTRVQRENAGDDAGASLCIFRAREGTDETSRLRVRYTLAHRTDDGRTSLFTVATECGGTIEALFPAEGDAPGGDIPGVPRPRDARRTFAANVEGEAYAVRIYETKASVREAVDGYDAEMRQAGWVRSEAVAKQMPNARSYVRGGVEIVATFETVDGVTTVALAPLTDEVNQ